MGFKSILMDDVNKVFLNGDEFGEQHAIDGKLMTVVVDGNEVVERSKKQTENGRTDGLFERQIIIYVANVRGAIQTENRGTGETDAIQFRYMVSGKVKNLSPGNVKRGETFGSKITMTVNRLLIELNGESVLEIDKISNKVVINGKDITAKIRKMC